MRSCFQRLQVNHLGAHFVRLEASPVVHRVMASNGFSIVGAMAAIVILGIGMLALVNIFPTSAIINARADRMSGATVLAEDKIEQFRFLGYNALIDSIVADTATTYATGTDTIGHIERTWTLTDTAGTINVTVDCSWPSPGRAGQVSIRLETAISNHD